MKRSMRPKPKLACYQTLESYLEALVDWKFEQRLESDRAWLATLGVDPEDSRD